jgi:hypothetical protein
MKPAFAQHHTTSPAASRGIIDPDTAAAAAELRQKTRPGGVREPVLLEKPERYSATASRNQSIFCGVAALSVTATPAP